MSRAEIKSDFLVIGSGIAGLVFAIKASRSGTVCIVTKKKNFDSSTNYAQGGIASVLAPGDSFESHIEDTLKAGCYLNDPEAVQLLVCKGPEMIEELISWGVNFSRSPGEGGELRLDLGKEGGHSVNRIAHAFDLTGREIENALLEKISGIKNIRVFEDHTAIDLLTEHQLKKDTDKVNCYGAYILDNKSGEVRSFRSKITLIASGGIGQVYGHTTNPDIATGDGIAMAYRAGALIADMEFMQFHPTTLYSKEERDRAFLISEAVRGEGGILYNSGFERIMEKLHPLADLAPRDIVARAIDSELKRSGEEFVYLDIRHLKKDFIKKRFPAIYKKCLERGIDITKEPIPVVPAAHYLCGGVLTDIQGRSRINRLYVSGEAACTGVHGANRLASNSLLEGTVFSDSACRHSAGLTGSLSSGEPEFPEWSKGGTFNLREKVLIKHNLRLIRTLMWDYVGIVRSDQRLELADKRINDISDEIESYYQKTTISRDTVELRNLATIARLIIRSALARPDSIGLHFNIDRPATGSELKRVFQKSGSGAVLLKLGEKPDDSY